MGIIHFELKKRLQEATQSGKFMVTISYLDGKNIEHHTLTNNFPKEDILPSFKQLIQDMNTEIELVENAD